MFICTGSGASGELGDGNSSSTFEPWAPVHNSSVPVEVRANASFAAVCTGGAHSCALEPSGKAWCWGERGGRHGGGGLRCSVQMGLRCDVELAHGPMGCAAVTVLHNSTHRPQP